MSDVAAIAVEEIAADDFARVWPLFEPAIREGETIALPRDAGADAARAYWAPPGSRVFMARLDGADAGSAYLRPNQAGPGSHVANAGFVTAPASRGRGVARAMAQFAMQEARRAGYLAMQFNFVVASNAPAVRLWRALGFEIAATLPRAFRRPGGELVDALVMRRDL